MMLTSILMYSVIRFSKKYSLSAELTSFAMIGLPIPVYTLMSLLDNTAYHFRPLHVLTMVIQGIVFVYLGNLYAIRGIQAAPNPGFSVLVSKIYVVFTAPLSVILFSSPLSNRSIVAILIILIFSYFVLIERTNRRSKSESGQSKWVIYTIFACLCFGGNAISSKYLLNGGLPISYRLLFPGLVATALYLPGVIRSIKLIPLKNKNSIAKLLFTVALCSIIFNFSMQLAFVKAPNVGYVNAANVSSTALLALTSSYIFKDILPKRKLIGIIGVMLGTYLLFLG